MNKDIHKTKLRRGGRPSAAEAGMIEDEILDVAAALFFDEGYGAVSIEDVARRAHISKRTFYVRYDNKAALFRAVVQRIIKRIRPTDAATDQLFKGTNTEDILRRIAPILLKGALSPESLSLQRVMMAEAKRFPELALIMHEQSARQEAISRIANLLKKDSGAGKQTLSDPFFVAEQFMFMVTAAPQRRALGLGIPLRPHEIETWANNAVSLFLNGYRRRP